MKGCDVEGCPKPHSARGYCNLHYQRFLRWGTPTGGAVEQTPTQRFESLFTKAGPTPPHRPELGPCWQWRLKPAKNGYAYFSLGRKNRWLAHRYSYELFVGSIPEGLVVDHLCRNRLCVNPGHLEPVEHLVNLERGAGYGVQNGMRTACVHGHEYTEENTYRDPDGGIHCRECSRAHDRKPERLARKRVGKAS